MPNICSNGHNALLVCVCVCVCLYVCGVCVSMCVWCVCLYVSVYMCVVCVCGVCVYVFVCGVCVCIFFNILIYQHAPLLMSNTTCIVLNFTYYDLSCLYTFYNIY